MTTQLKRIVVGIDGSEESKRALRWGAKLAADLGVGIDAIAAWQYPVVYGWAMPRFDPQADMRKFLAITVNHALDPDRAADVRLLVREGNPARVLIEQSHHALMLIVGSRGYGGFTGMLLGSVSAAVAEHAVCPVLVIHGDRDPLDGRSVEQEAQAAEPVHP